VAIYTFGFLNWKMPPLVAKFSLLSNPIIYLLMVYNFPEFTDLTYLAVSFILNFFIISLITLLKPLKDKKTIPEKNQVRFERNLLVFIWGIFIVIFVLSIYVLFI
jgi:uncharacterized sodium:solute symporter family permease YidK